MEYVQFQEKILKKRDKHPFDIRNSYGVYDAYKYIRKNKWFDIGKPLKESEFYSIIRGVNNIIASLLAEGHTVIFPERMGKLELRKFEVGASLVDGKLKITYPVDWGETLKLWFKDEEERQKKTLLRKEDKYIYHIRYDKDNANYENKGFYRLNLNRNIKKALTENVNNKSVDTLW